MECEGICDVDERIECYKKINQQYRIMVLTLFTLKHEFERKGFEAYIEPDIDGKPDLLVLANSNEAAAMDHKVITAQRKENILKQLEDVNKYIKSILWGKQKSEYNIKDSCILCPIHVWDHIINKLGNIRNVPVPVISYRIEEGMSIIFQNKTSEIYSFSTRPMQNLFKSKERTVKIPKQAYRYKLILEKPPTCYLISLMYEGILMARTNYVSKEIIVSFDVISDYIKYQYPRFHTTEGYKTEQFNKSRLFTAWKTLSKIGVIELIKENIAKAKLPTKFTDEYILEKLAKYDIKRDPKCKAKKHQAKRDKETLSKSKKKFIPLDKWFKSTS